MRDVTVDGGVAGDEGPAGPAKPIAAIRLVGGHVALDFVNTVDWRGRTAPEDYLVNFAALVDWTRHAGLASAAEARTLRRRAASMPARAAALLRTVVELREAAHRLF